MIQPTKPKSTTAADHMGGRFQALDQRQRHQRFNSCIGALHGRHQWLQGAKNHQIVSWEDVPSDPSEHVLAPDLWGEKNTMSLVVIATRRGRISTYSICYININITCLVDIHFASISFVRKVAFILGRFLSHPTSSHLVQFQWGNFPKILFQSISFSESLSFWECILAWCARSWIEALFYWQPLLRPRRYPCRRLGHKQVDSRTQGGSKKKWERLT